MAATMTLLAAQPRHATQDHVPNDPATEQELLRRDRDHRLANLLQLVASGLLRASRRSGDEGCRAIDGAASRLRAVERLQEALAGLDAQNSLPCAAMLERLCAMLDRLVVEPAGHRLAFHAEPGSLNAVIGGGQLYCLASLATELVINAVKHAFPGAGGTVTVRLSRAAEELHCTVQDDGVGDLPEPGCEVSQGMQLALRLAHRAGGRCRWVFGNDGTTATVMLPSAIGTTLRARAS